MEKINLDSKENILLVKKMIESGVTEGTLKKKHGIRRNSYESIKNNRIDMENPKVSCLICNKLMNYITHNHLKLHNLTMEEYFSKFPNAKFISAEETIKYSKRVIGKTHSKETLEKLKQVNIGKTHSDETKKKLSNLSKGDKNPAKRPEVREKLKANHISKTNPEKWKEIVKSNGERHTGYKKTPEQMQNWINSIKHTSKHGSKAQIYAYNYLKKYFGIFYHTDVLINDNSPFKDHTENFFCDITIPEYKISLEWNGPLHYLPIFGEEHLKKIQNNDKAKDALLYQRGWKVFHIKDECPDGYRMKTYVKTKCREYFPQIMEYINNKMIGEVNVIK